MGVGWQEGLAELSRFMRLETGLFSAGIAVSGFLVFSPPGFLLVPLFLGALLSSSSIYSYNHLTDREEDSVNGGVNPLSYRKAGRYVPVMAGAGAGLSAIMLPLPAGACCLAALGLGLAYSALRLKALYFLKNPYTGSVMSLVFLAGALAAGQPLHAAAAWVPLPFLLGFSLNLLGDIRGLAGDRAAGLRTLPVLLGPARASLILHIMLWCGAALAAVAYHGMASLSVFLVLLSLFLARDDMKMARACILLSFSTLPVFLAVLLWT